MLHAEQYQLQNLSQRRWKLDNTNVCMYIMIAGLMMRRGTTEHSRCRNITIPHSISDHASQKLCSTTNLPKRRIRKI